MIYSFIQILTCHTATIFGWQGYDVTVIVLFLTFTLAMTFRNVCLIFVLFMPR